MPANFARALHAHSFTTPHGVRFGPGGVTGETVIGQFNSAVQSGIGMLNLATRRLTMISRYPPQIGGMGAMTVDPPWVVWEQLDSQTNLNDWSIHVWNQTTGAAAVLATSRLPNGKFAVGQEPLPVAQNGDVAWAQPVPGTGRYNVAQVRVANLSTGRVSVLTTGRVSSPVYAGPYLVWGDIDSAGHYLLRIANAATLKPITTPGPLRNPGTLVYLAGSASYLAWGSGDLNTLTVWQIGASRTFRFSQSDSGHPFEFLQIAGHFLLWYTGNGSSVLDLRTGDAFDIGGTVAETANTIAIEEPVGSPATKGGYVPSRVSVLPVTAAPDITGCTRNGQPGS
jgi:hypothetical protein